MVVSAVQKQDIVITVGQREGLDQIIEGSHLATVLSFIQDVFGVFPGFGGGPVGGTVADDINIFRGEDMEQTVQCISKRLLFVEGWDDGCDSGHGRATPFA